MATAAMGFSPELFQFLADLARNNNRDWFHDNEDRFQEEVLDPCVDFVERFGKLLPRLSGRLVADPRPAGGSILRNQRDARFVKNGGPYYPSMRLAFRHERADVATAPALLVHLEPDTSYLAAGLERRDPRAARRVRTYIEEEPERWRRIVRSATFQKRFLLDDGRLQRVPPDVDREHPLADELRRRWFIARLPVSDEEAIAPDFARSAARSFRSTLPLMRYLADAMGVEL